MNYQVDWHPEAEADLARLWTSGVARKTMARAQARIDSLLATDPWASGIHVSEGLFAVHESPLYVQYEIDQGTRRVVVVSLSYMP